MVIYRGGNNPSLSCLRLLLRQQQRNRHGFAEQSQRSPRTHSQVITDVIEAKPKVARVDMKKWKKLDSRALGIERGAIPLGPWTVMKILRHEGFDSYLVGGCVRDLLLKKTPKDFDVITTASLRQIKKQFHRAEVVGQRFPICVVHIRDSATEVSSFETIAKHAEPSKQLSFSQAPHGCEIKDFTLWRDSMRRDFTVNSLFLDPFSNVVYDYSSGMSDLTSLKLRTIIPAKVSFEEDCARILRGLRIAARLGLSFSKDTERALLKLSPSVTRLGKPRLFMEVNYMLSYGAALPSLFLLQRFNLLKLLLPLQGVYLGKPPGAKSGQSSRMLMKLLSNLDKVVNCDHPTDCRLWIGLLAFHMTLVDKPQDPLVVLTLASILYHGQWKEGIRYARENAQVEVHFSPELLGSSASKSDEELADEVSRLAALVQASVRILTEPEILLAAMSRYPTSSCSGLVYIPYRVGNDVAELFQMLVKQNPFAENKREDFVIDYNLLGKGFMWETRFVLGKIILETIGCKTLQSEENAEKNETVVEEDRRDKLSSLLKKHVLVKNPGRNSFLDNDDSSVGKQKVSLFAMDWTPKKKLTQQETVTKKDQKVDDEVDNPSRKILISMVEEIMEKRYESQDGKLSLKKSEVLKKEIIEVNIEDSTNKRRKSNNSKEKTPHADKSCESADSEVTATKEENGENVKKSKKKRKSKSSVLLEEEGVKKNKKQPKTSELLEEKETEKKSRDVKKTKSKSKVVQKEEKDGDDDNKTKKKRNKTSESLVEEIKEEKKEDVRKTKCKSNSKRSVKDPEKEVLEPKVGRKKRDSKKEEVGSNSDRIQEDDNKEMAVREMDENERKQVVENKSRIPLSSLFR